MNKLISTALFLSAILFLWVGISQLTGRPSGSAAELLAYKEVVRPMLALGGAVACVGLGIILRTGLFQRTRGYHPGSDL